jgi:DNA-directed RNA polymerase subunit H (RpoH/RPB5)
MKEEIDIFQSNLVPKHEILDEDEKNKLLEKYGVTAKQLPKIKLADPVIQVLNGKKGDVVKILRKSQTTADFTDYYRIVV